MDKLHFWYSETQAKIYMRNGFEFKNYAIIDGKEVVYTMCSKMSTTPSSFSDAKYLGAGTYSRMLGSW